MFCAVTGSKPHQVASWYPKNCSGVLLRLSWPLRSHCLARRSRSCWPAPPSCVRCFACWRRPAIPITEHTLKTERHTTFYLAAGPEDGTLVIFVHGWPELSISWGHQLPALAALGFRTIAPDMRRYGRSSVYSEPAAYAQEPIVRDMLDLLDLRWATGRAAG